MSNDVLFCTNCDEEREFKKKPTDIIHEIKGESINVKVNIPYCVSCGSQLSDLETENSHYDLALKIYRKSHNLLTPEEIKEIRLKYSLSQRAFARALGFAEATINRYELGALQDNLHNNILLLCREPSNFLIIINQNIDNLSQIEYDETKNLINRMLQHKKESLKYSFVEAIKNDSINRLELMIMGLSKKVDDLEKKQNNPFYFDKQSKPLFERKNLLSTTTWENLIERN